MTRKNNRVLSVKELAASRAKGPCTCGPAATESKRPGWTSTSRKPAVLDPDTTQLDNRPATARARLVRASALVLSPRDPGLWPVGREAAGLETTDSAAAFDTRLAGVPVLTGRASRSISRLLRRHGYRLIVPPESFVVTKLNTLAGGEPSRARLWGKTLAAAAGLAVPAA